MLRRLALQFSFGGNPRHQHHMHIDSVGARQVVAKLAYRLQERHRLDVTDGAPNLANDEIEFVVAVQDEVLDLVGNVRNYLDGGAKIVASALPLDNVLVDAASGDVVVLVRRASCEALKIGRAHV